MPARSFTAEHALDERARHRPAAEQRRGKAHALLVGKADDFNGERQPLAALVQIGDAGNRGDDAERAVPFAGIAHRIVMRAQHQARQPRPLALVTAADIADGVEMRGHAGIAHPGQNEIGRGAVFRGEENPRQMFRRLGDRPEPVDPANDFIAEQGVLPSGRRFCLAHAHPVRRRWPSCALLHRYKFDASG